MNRIEFTQRLSAVIDGNADVDPYMQVFWDLTLEWDYYGAVALRHSDGVEVLNWGAPWMLPSAIEQVFLNWDEIYAEWVDYDVFHPIHGPNLPQ